MCVIVDTNTLSRLKDPADEDLEPVRNWLAKKNGKIVYSNTEKFSTEWKKAGMKLWIRERSRANQLRFVTEGVREKELEVKDQIRSDDEHIIALALVADVKILVSYSNPNKGLKGDVDLFKDFKDSTLVGGRVYTRKSHAPRMLTRDTCP